MSKLFSTGFDIIKGTFLLITVPLVIIRLKETSSDILNSDYDLLTSSLGIWFNSIALVFICIDYVIVKQLIRRFKQNADKSSERQDEQLPGTEVQQAIRNTMLGAASIGVAFLITKAWIPNIHSFEAIIYILALLALYLITPIAMFYLSTKLSLALRKKEKTKTTGTTILLTNILLMALWIFLMTINFA